ncbi:hypothetical protein GCM10028784_09840 [Myceligenerans cantabricum]
MTDDAHALRPASSIRGAAAPGGSGARGTGLPWRRRAGAAAGAASARFGRWLGRWGRRLVLSVWFWAGLVAGFGTSLRMWESVLLLAVVGWIAGAWLWSRQGRPGLLAVSAGILLGWVPMLILFVGALPHTVVGLPGTRYDL